MPRRRALPSSLFVCLAGAALGCSSAEPSPAPTSQSNQLTCTTDPRVTPFSTGIGATSTTGRFGAEILNASPSPPRRAAGGTGLNDWTMRFQIANAPLAADATVTVTTFMPDHGHGSARTPEVSLNPDGTYAVKGIYFFMAGVWEVSFLVEGEAAKFTFCIE